MSHCGKWGEGARDDGRGRGGGGEGGYIDRKAYVYFSCMQEGGEYGGWGAVFMQSE